MSDSWKRAWEPVVSRVGADSTGGVIRWGADAVEKGTVRRFIEPLELDCPLHYDEAVAIAHGYENIVAPYSSAPTFTMGAYWSPRASAFTSAHRNAEPSRRAIDPAEYPREATKVFATDFEAEYVRPPIVGDRLGGTGRRLVDVVLKETRVGRGAFLKFESQIVDAQQRSMLTTRTGLFVYEPKDESSAGAASSAREIPHRPAPADWATQVKAPDLDRQRIAADIRVGELMPPVAFPLPVVRLVMVAGANRDFNLVHHNTEVAKATGAPEMFANTLFLQSMWEVLVRNYIGCAGTIKRIAGFRMGSFNCAGDTVTVKGTVAKVTAQGSEAIVDLHVWSENSYGVSVGPGTVTVGIPVKSRSI